MGIAKSTNGPPAAAEVDEAAASPPEAEPVPQLVTELAARLPRRESETGPLAGWEYKTVVIEHGFMGWRREEIDRRALDAELERLGAEGWELVEVFLNQRIRGQRGGHLMLFKRPSPDG